MDINLFINSGKYEIIYSKVYQTKKFNKAKSVNPQSNIWNDVILKKIKKFSFKVKNYDKAIRNFYEKRRR